MAFNFGISADSAVRNVRKSLSPWQIHDVKFTGCEIREFDGKKDPTAHYKVLAINFENEEGTFSVTNFFPKDGDNERREFDSSNGGKVVMPSNFEVLMAIVKQTAEVLTPEGFAKMQQASSKFKSFDDVANALIKITDKVKGKETKLKLIGRNRDGRVVADIPRIVGINKQGESFISDNYIGDKLFFSDYEETQRAKYTKATPTEMPVNEVAVETPAKDDDLDLEDLL